MDPSSSRDKKKLILIGGAFIVLLFVVVALLVLRSKPAVTKTNPAGTEQPSLSVTPVSFKPTGTAVAPMQGAIAKVGDEYLYDADLNYELTYYPAADPQGAREIVTAKMIEDSVILQGAAADGMIRLDPTIYNSREKDYAKRIETVKQLKDQLDQKATVLEGSVISIWFNNMGPGAIGYDKGKSMALAEITRLQKDLADKKISMDQAGYQIKNNLDLAQLDSSYRANAIFSFSVDNDQKITYNPDIDKQIYALNQGDISGVLTGKDLDPKTGQSVDAVYMVAQVTKRGKTTVTSYDKWLEEKSKAYPVVKY